MITDSQPGHIDQIKQINAGVVYRLIDRYGPISRIDLARKAHLAPASITKIVREMVDAHLVQETEFQELGSRGRPAVALTLDTVAWHYLSVRIGYGTITLALRDLSSVLLVEDVLPLPVTASEPLLIRIISEIDGFFYRHQEKLERLTAIAVTLPGIVDAEKGIIHHLPFYQADNIPLGPELKSRTGLPVYLQHDVCAWLLAESFFGAAKDTSEVIQVVIDHHVTAGAIVGGRLLHGGGKLLVEIGHTQVEPYGKQCYCGNQGCLETVASCESILAMASSRMRTSNSRQEPLNIVTIESLCEAAVAGERWAKDIITDVGYNVGRILAVMVNLLNPQKILIGSPLNAAKAVLYPAITDCIRRQAFPSYSAGVVVQETSFQNEGTLPGAALIKDALYNGSLLLRLLQG
ncbi:ROK family protein [Erwinia tracheiphila]|uniref:ROK family transcriptional regulator n=1 Tax=Erwinia tracheiphila TaxID=65700 RepID=A0A345CQU9_9GAMM|nr:ROK family transcriptional regulator [Erwinia tracheiphila]AXF75816.1 ROK family transcriptional regulator [Erwinia tracheiphila]UIA85535.1 ROK family protein [Erwinia tracheiphila]UIA94056.1 ROK family protein [Erwinia tracheiphila]